MTKWGISIELDDFVRARREITMTPCCQSGRNDCGIAVLRYSNDTIVMNDVYYHRFVSIKHSDSYASSYIHEMLYGFVKVAGSVKSRKKLLHKVRY